MTMRLELTKRTRRLLALIPLLMLLALISRAGQPEVQTRLIFPELTQKAGVQVGYAITSPNSEFHQVTLTAYDNAGNPIQGEDIENPAELFLFGYAQQSRLAADIFNLPPELEFEGWIEVTSTAAELKGFFLTLEDGLDRVDGSDATIETGSLAILPVPANAEVDRTQIHVVNADEDVNQASIRLMSSAGAVLQEAQRVIPGKGKLRETLQELLPLSASMNDVYVVVEGDHDLAAYESVRAGNSLAGFNGIIPGEVEQLYSPQLATGPGFETGLQLTNTSGLGVAAAGAQTLNLEITAHAEDGALLAAATQNPRQVSLAPGELFQMDTANFFGIPLDELRSGWIEIQNQAEGAMPLSGSVIFGAGQAGAFNAALPLVSEGKKINVFSHVAQGDFGPIDWFTGLAFLYTGEGQTELLITVRNKDGRPTHRGRQTLSSNQRVSKTLPQLVSNFNRLSGGSIQVESSREIAAFSLFGLADLSVLAAIPTQAIRNPLQVVAQGTFGTTVTAGMEDPEPITLPAGQPVYLNYIDNQCPAGLASGKAASPQQFKALQGSPQPAGNDVDEFFDDLPEDPISALTEFKRYGPILDDDLEDELDDLCELVFRSFSNLSASQPSFRPGALEARIERFLEDAYDFFDSRSPRGADPSGGPGPLRLLYSQPLASIDFQGQDVVIDIHRNDCNPPPRTILEGNIEVPSELYGTVSIFLNFFDSEGRVTSVAVVDNDAAAPAGDGDVLVPYRASVPAGNYTPVFRVGNRGLFEGGPFFTGSFILDPIPVDTDRVTMNLAFPEMVVVTGNVADFDGSPLSDLRSVRFFSGTAEIFTERNVPFRVMLPRDQDYDVQIVSQLRTGPFPAGNASFLARQITADQDQDLGELRFGEPPDLMTINYTFLAEDGRPLEDLLMDVETIELTDAPGFSFTSRGARADANGVASIELLPGKYRVKANCELCR